MYEKFISKYKNQVIPTNIYTEKHHILPKHMGGLDIIDNLIVLMYRQHILAHLLLYRKYRKIEDLTAYKLMRSYPEERKSLISKMIGEKHKISGHIYRLGNSNRDSNFINEIKTKESLSRGGKRAGQIAKETGSILKIRTEEGSILGGKIAGNIAKESGQIQRLGKYKGLYVLIMPDGNEFQHAFQAAEYMKIDVKLIHSRCKAGSFGYSRRPKTEDELAARWDNIE